MSITEYQDYFPRTKLTPEVVFAGQYLEARGYSLGTHYGTVNAVSKATEMIIEGLERDEDQLNAHAV